MTVKTAEKHLKEIAAKAEIFEKAVNGYDGGKLLYTVNCICAAYDSDSRVITITTPLNWQRCFHGFRQAFEAFSSMVKKLVADDKSSRRAYAPYKQIDSLSNMGYLFYSPEEELEKTIKNSLDDMFSANKNSSADFTMGLCEYETFSAAFPVCNTVNLTVSLISSKNEENRIIPVADEIIEKNYPRFDPVTAADRKEMLVRLNVNADKFTGAVRQYEEKGLKYVLTSASAAGQLTDKVNLISPPCFQMAFADFNAAYLLFFSHIIANLSAMGSLKITHQNAENGGAAGEDVAEIKITSVFENAEEEAPIVYKEAAEGKSVCLCTYQADNTTSSTRSYVGLFACMAD